MCRTGNGEEGRCVRRDVTHGRAAPLSIPAAQRRTNSSEVRTGSERTAARYEQAASERASSQRATSMQRALRRAARNTPQGSSGRMEAVPNGMGTDGLRVWRGGRVRVLDDFGLRV